MHLLVASTSLPPTKSMCSDVRPRSLRAINSEEIPAPSENTRSFPESAILGARLCLCSFTKARKASTCFSSWWPTKTKLRADWKGRRTTSSTSQPSYGTWPRSANHLREAFWSQLRTSQAALGISCREKPGWPWVWGGKKCDAGFATLLSRPGPGSQCERRVANRYYVLARRARAPCVRGG